MKRKRIAFLLLVVVIGSAFLSLQVYIKFVPNIKLYVTMTCPEVDVENCPRPPICSLSNEIALNDSMLEQSPKLKAALVEVPSLPLGLSDIRRTSMTVSGIEFDAMNQMLLNTKEAKAAVNGSQHIDPTDILWPKDETLIYVNYNGQCYQLAGEHFFWRSYT